MGIRFNSELKNNYTTIKTSDTKTGTLEIKSASKTNHKEPIKLQLTYVGHRDKMISAPLRERTSTDGSTQPPSLPVGLRFKSRKDLEKMMAHPKRLNSALNHIASLNLQAPTPLENLSLQQLKDVDALIRICHDRHTPKLLKNAISEQILSNVKPQALLKNPQLLCRTIKVMSNLDLQTQTKPENLSSEKLQDLTALLNIYNDSKAPEPVKQAISNQVLSKIEPKGLVENPKLLQENLQLISSLNLQTFVRGNLNALQKDLANADTDSLAKHLKELNTPEAKQNFKTLNQLIKTVKNSETPSAIKQLITDFFQHPKTGISRQERKEFEKLQKDLPILLKRYPEQLKQTLELQKTVREATKDIDPFKVNQKKIVDIGKILEIPEPPSPKDMSAIAKLASNSINIPNDATTDSLQLSKTTKDARSAYIGAMKNYKAMAQEEIKNAKGGHKKPSPKALMEAYNTAITAYKSAIATYDDEVKALEENKNNKLLFEARNAMDKLSKIAFHKDAPPELFDLITKNVMEYGKPNNELIMEFMSGVSRSIISTLTAKGLPMIESSAPNLEYFHRRAREHSQNGEPQQIESYLFYDVHAEHVQKVANAAQDKLLFYNTQDIHDRPLAGLHTDDIGTLLVEYKKGSSKQKMINKKQHSKPR